MRGNILGKTKDARGDARRHAREDEWRAKHRAVFFLVRTRLWSGLSGKPGQGRWSALSTPHKPDKRPPVGASSDHTTSVVTSTFPFTALE